VFGRHHRPKRLLKAISVRFQQSIEDQDSRDVTLFGCQGMMRVVGSLTLSIEQGAESMSVLERSSVT
jgi:hypothetical protein